MAGIANFASRNAAQVADVNISSSGDNTIIAASAGNTIRIVKLVLAAQSPVAITLKDGSTAVFGPATLTSVALDNDNCPLILTSGNAFVINLGAAVQVGGYVMYIQSPVGI